MYILLYPTSQPFSTKVLISTCATYAPHLNPVYPNPIPKILTILNPPYHNPNNKSLPLINTTTLSHSSNHNIKISILLTLQYLNTPHNGRLSALDLSPKNRPLLYDITHPYEFMLTRYKHRPLTPTKNIHLYAPYLLLNTRPMGVNKQAYLPPYLTNAQPYPHLKYDY